MNSLLFINVHLEFYLVHPDLVDHLYLRLPYQFKNISCQPEVFVPQHSASVGDQLWILHVQTHIILRYRYGSLPSLWYLDLFFIAKDLINLPLPVFSPRTWGFGCHSTKIDSKKTPKNWKFGFDSRRGRSPSPHNKSRELQIGKWLLNF